MLLFAAIQWYVVCQWCTTGELVLQTRGDNAPMTSSDGASFYFVAALQLVVTGVATICTVLLGVIVLFKIACR